MAVGPTHRQNHRKSHQLLLSQQCWENKAKLGDIIDVEGNLIESVTDVDFDEVGWAMSGSASRILRRMRSKA
jgi:hypothetical protein